jgi:hypothetical protein
MVANREQDADDDCKNADRYSAPGSLMSCLHEVDTAQHVDHSISRKTPAAIITPPVIQL